jgi:hypothetical protein
LKDSLGAVEQRLSRYTAHRRVHCIHTKFLFASPESRIANRTYRDCVRDCALYLMEAPSTGVALRAPPAAKLLHLNKQSSSSSALGATTLVTVSSRSSAVVRAMPSSTATFCSASAVQPTARLACRTRSTCTQHCRRLWTNLELCQATRHSYFTAQATASLLGLFASPT